MKYMANLLLVEGEKGDHRHHFNKEEKIRDEDWFVDW